MKRFFCFCAALVLILSLGGCSLTPPADNSLPGRMVAAIDISTRPFDEGMERNYTGRDTLGPIIQMLRNLDNEEPLEYDPLTDAEQETCTITATYANGDNEVYCILERRFLRKGQGDWHPIDPEQFSELERFIRDNPSDR